MARLTSQGNHVVLKCTGDACGMRYPSPALDPRRDACPLCESPTELLDTYPEAAVDTDDLPNDDGILIGVLDNIRSALNVGAMLRSADGSALDHLYLGGLTAAVDNPKVAKTALGAHLSVPATSALDVLPVLHELRRQGCELWAIDRTPDSVALSDIRTRPNQLAFVVGNERAGVDPAILAMADRHVHLKMHGAKTTLNVGVAFGSVAYWLRALPLG